MNINASIFPFAILSVGSILCLFASMLFKKGKEQNSLFAWISILTLIACLACIMQIVLKSEALGSLFVFDTATMSFAIVALAISFLSVPLLASKSSTITDVPSSLFSMFLLSCCGALLMIFGNHLLIVLIGLELLSVPLYVLTGMGLDKPKCSEASFKYFTLGAIASSVLIYGIAYVWGITGTMTISELALRIQSLTGNPTLLVMALVFVFTAFAFKLGLFPFHFWVPDVYQAAPSTLVAWMSGLVKVAVLAFMLRFLVELRLFEALQWANVILFLGVISMLWGSLAALVQKDLKRLLGYSTISHVGYMCLALAVAVHGDYHEVASALSFYVLLYGLASLISFAVISVEEASGRTQVTDLEGLAGRKPWLAASVSIAMLSLAGLPPLGGFWAKFQVFALAVDKGYLLPVVIALLTSVISLGYYLKIIVNAFMRVGQPREMPSYQITAGAAVSVAVLATILLGIFPSIF